MNSIDKTKEIFEDAPVGKAVQANVIPAMAAMVMVLIYNLADTFFIAQTHDALQVAAVSLATPVFLVFMALGTIFGIGGTSVISRALGQGKRDYARKTCAFSFWACIAVGTVVAILFLSFMDPLLSFIGTSPDTWEHARKYLTIVSLSGPFVLIANCYSCIIRSEGESGKAMMGQLLGNLINIVLDPIMILVLKWDITGAALATVIGNTFGAIYYIAYFLKGTSILSIKIKDFSLKERIPGSVLAIGVPAALGSLLMSLSQVLMNSQMVRYGDMAVAGMGVAMKVSMMTGILCIGLGQGVQPLLGYTIGSENWDRYRKSLRFSLLFALALSSALTLLCLIFTRPIVSTFLSDTEAFTYGVTFSRILLTTSFLFGVYYVITNALQAFGAAKESLMANISRQGLIYIPAMYILGSFMAERGLIWAQPVADILSFALAVYLYLRVSRKAIPTLPRG